MDLGACHLSLSLWSTTKNDGTNSTARQVEAIEATNPDCTVQHLPGLVRIKCLGKIVITRDSVEEKLGRDWETHEFQMAIVSYFGHIKDWDDDEIVIAWDH